MVEVRKLASDPAETTGKNCVLSRWQSCPCNIQLPELIGSFIRSMAGTGQKRLYGYVSGSGRSTVLSVLWGHQGGTGMSIPSDYEEGLQERLNAWAYHLGVDPVCTGGLRR